MALENVLERLTRAIELQGEASAVAEVIRQRNDAQRVSESVKSDRDWYKNRMSEIGDEKRKCERRISALQGVITKMKRKAKEL